MKNSNKNIKALSISELLYIKGGCGSPTDPRRCMDGMSNANINAGSHSNANNFATEL